MPVENCNSSWFAPFFFENVPSVSTAKAAHADASCGDIGVCKEAGVNNKICTLFVL